ncbi:MAG TPA: chemotaxis protein CheW, partial [Armatimonadota bacterium]|nr:chemotaxis protein CheW [Armatimonadota bacterium]
VGEREAGIVVDELIGEQEIVIKSLGSFIGDVRGVSGATILGDGTVALIVDAAALLDKAADERSQPIAALEAATAEA